jgi:DNA replication protein DnaC
MMSTEEKIIEYAKTMRLPEIRKTYKLKAEEAVKMNSSYEEYLCDLLDGEYYRRLENRKTNRIRCAGFPCKKYLQDLNLDYLPEDARKRLKALKTLDFIREGQNVILAGNPGTGKTHLAIALGIRACMEEYKVLFVTIPTLITQLKESRSAGTLRKMEQRFEKYDLVIADELGYISFDKEGSELLFTNLSLRAGRKSTIITTNLSFERWQEIFNDPVLTAAMVDRLTHKAYIINMSGKSYRLKETREWLKTVDN